MLAVAILVSWKVRLCTLAQEVYTITAQNIATPLYLL